MDSPTIISLVNIAGWKAEFRSILISISRTVKTSSDSDSNSDSDFSSCDNFPLWTKTMFPDTDSDSDFSSCDNFPSWTKSTMFSDTDSDLSSCDNFPFWNKTMFPDTNSAAVKDLRSIACQMIAAGRSQDCLEVYARIRKPNVDELFNELEIEILDIKRLEWQIQEEKILHWMNAAKVCIRVLFAAEAELIKEIFDGLGTIIDDNSIADDCFTMTVKDSAVTLFNFVEEISSITRVPEKLFKILDLHRVLSKLLPDIELLFASKSGEVIRNKAVESLSNLSDTAREMLSEFEKVVIRNPTQFPVPEDSIHPLTEYVMNYIDEMEAYKKILSKLILTKPLISNNIPSDKLDFVFSEIDDHWLPKPLVIHLVWIIMELKFKLQLTSKLYKQAASAKLFIKNNADYIVEWMRSSLLMELVGDDYFNRLISFGEGTSKAMVSHSTSSQWKEEFMSILISISPAVKNKIASNHSSAYTDSDYSSWFGSIDGSGFNRDVVSDEAVHDLRSIADLMISAGRSRDCFKAYAAIRKATVDVRLDEVLGRERWNIKCIKRLEWRVQQTKIEHWINSAKYCVRVLFAGERAFANRIFAGDSADDCFIMTVVDSAVELFNFAEAISSGDRRSPEKLFRMLDLHQVMSELLPDIELIFATKSCELIRNQAVNLLSNLSETASAMLAEFEKAVFGELTRFSVPEGSVHPLTEYVMNYIHQMMEYKQILSQLIVTKPLISDDIRSAKLDFDFSEIDDQMQAPPLVLHLLWIIVVLKFKLQLKSKLYKQASSANLFIKNNVDYIVEKIRGLVELKVLVGDDYHIRLISLAEANFQKPTFKCRCF